MPNKKKLKKNNNKEKKLDNNYLLNLVLNSKYIIMLRIASKIHH